MVKSSSNVCKDINFYYTNMIYDLMSCVWYTRLHALC